MELSVMVLLRRGWAPVWVCEVLGAELALHKMHAVWLSGSRCMVNVRGEKFLMGLIGFRPMYFSGSLMM